MEIPFIHILSVVFYIALLFFIGFRQLQIDVTLLLAILATVFWLSQSIINNLGNDSYYLNYYSVLLSLFGWLIFLQATYLKIPNSNQLKYFSVYGVYTLLILLFVFQYHIDGISQNTYFEGNTLYFAAFIISISMIFYLENIIRCMKPESRFLHKHLIFALTLIALINFMNFYQLMTYKEMHARIHYLSLLIHLFVPFFLFISINRSAKIEKSHFKPGETGQVQYLMILIGSALVVAGLLQMFDLYFSQVRSHFYQAIFLAFLLAGVSVLVLSNTFRTELSLYLKSYFYGDRYDYKKEWKKVNKIIRSESGIYDKVVDYFEKLLDAQAGVIYIYFEGAMKLMSSSEVNVDKAIPNINILLEDGEKLSENVFFLPGRNQLDQYRIIVTLKVEDDMVGVCLLNVERDIRFIDASSLLLCDTVSSEFAVRLWEIRHKNDIQRKEKLATFNKTVAFLAHDLKNIIAQQKLALENFSKFRDDPEFLDDFNETISHSTDRLRDIISQFRVSSLNSKKSIITINQLKDAIDQKIRLSDKTIHFNFSDSGSSDQEIDAEMITVVENLLKNAAESSHLNRPIEISLLSDDQIVIEVTDQGEGMTQEFIENKLFEPFNSTKQDEGLGVGMYHVKTILDSLGASIDVQSKLNEGSKITVRVPV